MQEGTERTVCVVVDGNSLAHRAYHAYAAADLRARDGSPRGLLYGFLRLLAGVGGLVSARHGSATHLVVGLDDPDASWRRERWPEYKASRSAKHPDLYTQLGMLPLLLEELGVHLVVPARGEADDVLGAAGDWARAGAAQVVLVTSDRDALSHAWGGVEVLMLGNGLAQAKWMDDDQVQLSYGVQARRYVELAALRGDSSDNLNGAAGIGPKKAALLVNACESIDEFFSDAGYQRAQTLVGDKGAGALNSARADIMRNLECMRATMPEPIDFGAGAISLHDIDETLARWELSGVARHVRNAFEAPTETRSGSNEKASGANSARSHSPEQPSLL